MRWPTFPLQLKLRAPAVSAWQKHVNSYSITLPPGQLGVVKQPVGVSIVAEHCKKICHRHTYQHPPPHRANAPVHTCTPSQFNSTCVVYLQTLASMQLCRGPAGNTHNVLQRSLGSTARHACQAGYESRPDSRFSTKDKFIRSA